MQTRLWIRSATSEYTNIKKTCISCIQKKNIVYSMLNLERFGIHKLFWLSS